MMLMTLCALCVLVIVFANPVNAELFSLGALVSGSMGFVTFIPNVIWSALKNGVTPKMAKYRQVERDAEPIEFWLHVLLFGVLWIVSLAFVAYSLMIGIAFYGGA